MPTTICWFHNDFRLCDHRPLAAAMAEGQAVLPLYIHDDAAAGEHRPGGASRWWLHHSLAAIASALEKRGAYLLLAQGRAEEILPELIAATGAVSIHTASRHEPWAKTQMQDLRENITIPIMEHENALLLPPGTVVGKTTGRPLNVFTHFKKNLLAAHTPPLPIAAPERINAPPRPSSPDVPLDALGLLPRNPDWSGGIADTWTPGEDAAHEAFERFIAGRIKNYATARDNPSLVATSGLSPHLHFGEISPRIIYHRIMRGMEQSGDAEFFLSEVIWREFAYELLSRFPNLPHAPLRDEFTRFPWRAADDYAHDLAAWKYGRTGFPLVDAGMRELTATGWMHNRVRMITASFLTKHLLIPWQEGEKWFRDRLVDADLASNSANWQWVAGSGADAAPYFRIFNPITQGRKFGAHDYVLKWVPEVAGRGEAKLFEPMEGAIISHEMGRKRALEAFAAIRRRE